MNENRRHRATAGGFRSSVTRCVRGERLPVIAAVVLFALATGALFVRIGNAFDPDIGKDWWTLSFDSRNVASSSFMIENHSKATRFTYTVSRGGTTLATGTLSLAKGDTRAVPTDIAADSGRTSVSVIADDGTKKEIYRER